MVARELSHLAGEDRSSVRKQDLCLAQTSRVKKKVARRRVARVVLVTEIELQVAERDPRRLAAPARLDELGFEGQHGLEFRAGFRRALGLEAGCEAQPRDQYLYFYARVPMAALGAG